MFDVPFTPPMKIELTDLQADVLCKAVDHVVLGGHPVLGMKVFEIVDKHICAVHFNLGECRDLCLLEQNPMRPSSFGRLAKEGWAIFHVLKKVPTERKCPSCRGATTVKIRDVWRPCFTCAGTGFALVSKWTNKAVVIKPGKDFPTVLTKK